MLNEALKRVAVLGAGGKMGSGIAVLLLQEMARTEADSTGQVGSSDFRLILVDANETVLDALPQILKSQLVKYAERHINALRNYFALNPKLVSNEEIIEYFVNGAMNIVRLEADVGRAANSLMIFEAIVEDEDIKAKVLKPLGEHVSPEAFFFTNTSSIPIHILNEKAQLRNRIIGYHFYNPPPVQKLLEIIVPAKTMPQLTNLSIELAKRLQKTIVFSNDIAGFIGNGHFIREIMYACQKVSELSRVCPLYQAIYIVNKVTQDFLIRPMGIFQLLDYVGIDVGQKVCQIMSTYLPDELFQDPLIDNMIEAGLLGGQHPDGSQKDGFFQYEGHQRKAVYGPLKERYVPFTEENWAAACDKELGPLPKGHASWKHMQRERDLKGQFQNYFQNLAKENTQGAELALEFLLKSKDIARQLVGTGVAQKIEDVDTVLKNGFFHLYGTEDVHIELGTRR